MSNNNSAQPAAVISGDFWTRHFLLREFLHDQLPMVVITFAAAVAISYAQSGIVPGGDRAFDVAGVRVPIWHLVWMGLWTGYTMGLVGQASGIFSLPYTVSILQFESVAVSPTMLIVTFLNPFGALLGYWRGRQLNFDLAIWLCIGTALGSPFGPFIRVYWLADPVPFKAAIGLALFIMAVNMVLEMTPWYLKKRPRVRAFKEKFNRHLAESIKAGRPPSGLPHDFRIVTLERSWRKIKISYWGEEQTLSVPLLFVIGFLVGIASSTLGAGGGFLLVPIMVSFFGLPMYVLVAASIPFVIVLSVTGLITYLALPLFTGTIATPDWGFGLFIASGAILGAWAAAKTQRFIPEKFLKSMLSAVTGAVGMLYVVNYFWTLPFKV
ncbi:MAG: sulfite exporter TauE/SafE family protein [Rhodocyclaceae bacterium]